MVEFNYEIKLTKKIFLCLCLREYFLKILAWGENIWFFMKSRPILRLILQPQKSPNTRTIV